jgi:hypothetical protein
MTQTLEYKISETSFISTYDRFSRFLVRSVTIHACEAPRKPTSALEEGAILAQHKACYDSKNKTA